MPRIRHFMRKMDKSNVDPIPSKDLERVKNLAPERYNRDQHGIAAVRRWLKETNSRFYKEYSA